jgi:hypothetical protein
MNNSKVQMLDSVAHALLIALDSMGHAQTRFTALRNLPKRSNATEDNLDDLGLAMFHCHLNLLTGLKLLRVELSPSIMTAAVHLKLISH